MGLSFLRMGLCGLGCAACVWDTRLEGGGVYETWRLLGDVAFVMGVLRDGSEEPRHPNRWHITPTIIMKIANIMSAIATVAQGGITLSASWRTSRRRIGINMVR
ncbi:hypothetical protein BDN71DRAFT_1455887 [Pleurotus eryngii]|uniref:Uncharacterized protein n=1 Tax=Pleurotus eryngii TaxID=5323 RepID=A0A9P6D260_PLEER|nr:hypothetical protein BDN71DRAFT_1455887 [Pleurotus eryngii]